METKTKAKTGLLQKVKNTWNSISFTHRQNIKSMTGKIALALVCVGFVTPFLFQFAAPAAAAVSLGTAVMNSAVIMGVIGAPMALIGLGAMLPDAIREIRHGKDEVTWKNMAGQTVKSTKAQQRDLRVANHGPVIMVAPEKDGVPYAPVRLVHGKRLADAFQQVADKVTVVKDVENGNGKYRFNPPLMAVRHR